MRVNKIYPHTQFRVLLNNCVGIDVNVCGDTEGSLVSIMHGDVWLVPET